MTPLVRKARKRAGYAYRWITAKSRATRDNWVTRTLSAEQIVALQHLTHQHRFLSLQNPRTFNEKIQYRRLYEKNPRFSELSDKVRVKDHVKTTIGAQFVIPTLWSGKTLPPVAARSWPIPFVIKANHGCELNYFVRREAHKDWTMIEETCEPWLGRRHPKTAYEHWYNKIEPQLLIEPLLGDAEGSLIDYKFFVFGGRAEFVQVDTDRAFYHKRVFYDRHWTRQPFSVRYPLEPREIEKPRHFAEMLDAAEELAREFSFVRVDLYDLDSGPKFGELTFAPGRGWERFHPVAYDRVFGDLWR